MCMFVFHFLWLSSVSLLPKILSYSDWIHLSILQRVCEHPDPRPHPALGATRGLGGQ